MHHQAMPCIHFNNGGGKRLLLVCYKMYLFCMQYITKKSLPVALCLVCVSPVGGAVTLKVTVTSQHVRLPPNCRNPSSCWRSFHWSGASSRILNTHSQALLFPSGMLQCFSVLYKQKKSRESFCSETYNRLNCCKIQRECWEDYVCTD